MFNVEIELLNSPLFEIEILRLNGPGESGWIRRRRNDWKKAARDAASRVSKRAGRKIKMVRLGKERRVLP